MLRIKQLTLSALASSLFAFSAHADVNVEELVSIDASPLDRSMKGVVVSYAASLEKSRPAVVSVYSKSLGSAYSREELMMQQLFGIQPRRQQVPQYGLGSGVIVSENGYIITNNHVISQADEIKVQMDDKKIYDAELVGTDPSTDIAVLKIEAEGLPSITLADSDRIQVGDVVFAIGNPLGVGKTVTMGIVSATRRQNMGVIQGGFENFIQTDASINSGNSGGALVDAKGRLIGINTLIQTDGTSRGNIGLGFAVPTNLAYSVMSDLIKNGKVSRGFLGVGIEEVDEEKAEFFGVDGLNGALVNNVSADSPAEKAGIKAGDVIVGVDGAEVSSPADLRIKVSARKPGQEVKISIIRDKEPITLDVELAQLSDDGRVLFPAAGGQAASFLRGVSIEAIDEDLRKKFEIEEGVDGVVITQVDPNSPYVEMLPVGMVIQKVNGKNVSTPSEAASALKAEGKNMLLVTFRGVYRWISVEDED